MTRGNLRHVPVPRIHPTKPSEQFELATLDHEWLTLTTGPDVKINTCTIFGGFWTHQLKKMRIIVGIPGLWLGQDMDVGHATVRVN